ncbi:MAG: COG1615 family transporter, partial [Acidimicrobiales bacterium]|nr:COG1615 family transporter [Acidimicrobiales bacterium]
MATTSPTVANRRRLPLIVAGGILLLLALTASGIARLFTDYLFYDHLGFASSWGKILFTQIALAAVFTFLFFAILFGNLTIADRLKPDVRPPSPEEDLIERYHQLVGRHGTRVRVAVSGFLALMFGLQVSQEWQRWLLFTNSNDFGRVDPLHGRDAAFYVFQLPFLTFLVDWFSFAIIFSIFASALAHYLNGGIRAVAISRISAGVKGHLSILFAVLGVLRAVSYYFDTFELVNSRRGLFDGALATDVEVQLPALNLLVLVSLLAAALFLFNLRRNGWGLPLVALGMWAVTHVVVGGIFPSLFQRFAVEPNQSTRETQYIDDNIAGTRFAYGLEIPVDRKRQFAFTEGITVDEVEANADVLDDIIVVDPVLARDSFEKDQGERREYEFGDLDIDRYVLGDQVEPVAISVRELQIGNAEEGWENRHLVFTHGYGVAMAPANVIGSGGTPNYLVSGIRSTLEVDEGLEFDLTQPRIYFGEDFDGYAIVGAEGRNERDVVAESTRADSDFRYDGEGGVNIGSFVRQVAFSLRFQSINPLISPFVGDGSEVMYNRDVVDRVRLAAPFLRLDSDPYPVVSEGRIKYVIDAYTTTN